MRVKVPSTTTISAATAAAALATSVLSMPATPVSAPRPASAATSGATGGKPQRLTIPHDLLNEQVVIAAAIVDAPTRAKLTKRLKPDFFFGGGHALIWDMLCELDRRGLEYSSATVRQLSNNAIDESYLARLLGANPKLPANLSHHVEMLEWDRARVETARGPLHQLLEVMQLQNTAPQTVCSLARQIVVSFDGYGDRRYLRDPNELVRSQMIDIAERRVRKQCFPYGVPGLDVDRDTGEQRLIPGTAPGQITVVTGVPGSGKSTFMARVASSLVDQRRRVLYGAWEMKDGDTLELIAGMRIGLSREKLQLGALTDEEAALLAAEMVHVCQYIRFLDLPFGRQPSGNTKITNDRNLDTIHGYIADSAADVAIFDLWKRCLRQTKPEDEEDALLRQQSIAKETKTHCILVQQQRMKDVELRDDKRPTREGIKGSGAWVEVPDTILGTHRPALWKRVDDNTFEIIGLKQRWGKWPFAVEFDWNGEYGVIDNGRTVPYDPPGTGASMVDDMSAADLVRANRSKKK